MPLALAFVLVLAGTALAAVTLEKVVGGKGSQDFGFANDTYVAWSEQRTRGDDWDAFARPLAGGTTVHVNPKDTSAYAGPFDPGTDTVIYQQVRRRQSNIYLFDVPTKTRTAVGDINTRRWEWEPKVSSSYILFARDYRKSGTSYTSLYLYDRSAQTTKKLGTWARVHGRFVLTGGVGETYATWTVCAKTCATFVHDIGGDTTDKVPTKNGRAQYDGVVDEVNGTVYFARSGQSCGAKVRIFRVPVTDLSATTTKIFGLPDGIDISYELSLAPNTNGTDQDLLFTRYDCSRGTSDVYAARAVTAVT